MSVPSPQDSPSTAIPPRTRTTFRTLDNLQLVADTYGAPDAPPVILLHGGGQTRHAWGGTAQRLAHAGWYAISVDMRGHGESDWDSEEDYSLNAFSADVRTLCATLSQPPVVVGASLGGIAALLTEGESAATLFRAIVLVDIAPRMEAQGVNRIISFMLEHAEEGFATLEDAADAVASYMPNRPRPKDVSRLKKNLRQRADGRYIWHWDPKFLQGKQPPRASKSFDRLFQAAQRLTIPTLLVRGMQSDVVSEAGVREFLEAVPHAHYTDVSEAGHMVAGDRNDVFSQAVIAFLRDLPSP